MPLNPGCTPLGRVIAVGDEVASVRPGDRIMMEQPHGSHALIDERRDVFVIIPEEINDAQRPQDYLGVAVEWL